MDEIQKEYQELSMLAASASYVIFVKNKELEQVQNRLMYVNQEAAARIELNKSGTTEAVQPGEQNV
jgi:hypothetical protein